MDVDQALLEAGGVAPASVLLRVAPWHEIRAAVATGVISRVARGRYALPGADAELRAAAELSGVLVLLSAARYWGWPVKLPPERPQVAVPRGRNVPPTHRRSVEVRWAQLDGDDLTRGVTSKVRTVLDCARFLPFDAALAVADSALRDGVTKTELLLAARRAPRTGRGRAYRVVEAANVLAANPFESVLRAVLMDVPEAHFEPQVWVGSIGRPDLVDRERRVVVEADSFEFHSDASSLSRDIERYNAFVCEGHVVLRFAWKHAMFEQDYVRESVTSVVARQGRSARGCPTCRAA